MAGDHGAAGPDDAPMTRTSRYAAYWAPAREHPLWRAGCDWLGRDPETGQPPASPRARRERAAHYGLHATLKAPRRLADGVDASTFIRTLATLAHRSSAFDMPALGVVDWGGFVALRPIVALPARHALRGLADACVRELEPLCARPTAADAQARERAHRLDAGHRDHLGRWGYPFVLERWAFHVTLSDPQRGADAVSTARCLAHARRHFAAALREPLRCEAVSVFEQRDRDTPFTLACRLPLGR